MWFMSTSSETDVRTKHSGMEYWMEMDGGRCQVAGGGVDWWVG